MDTFGLPEETLAFLHAREELQYDHGACVVGPVTLARLDQLHEEMIRVYTGRSPMWHFDPHKHQHGHYTVRVVDLVVASSRGTSQGILMWLPELALFGQHDAVRQQTIVFGEASWSDIVASPALYLGATWDPRRSIGKHLSPWHTYPFVREIKPPEPKVIEPEPPNSTLVRDGRGECAMQCNELDEAEYVYTSHLAHDPDSLLAHYGLGRLSMIHRTYGMARMHFEIILAAEPDNTTAHLYLALLDNRDGRKAAAKAHLDFCRRPEARDDLLQRLENQHLFMTKWGIDRTIEILQGHGFLIAPIKCGPMGVILRYRGEKPSTAEQGSPTADSSTEEEASPTGYYFQTGEVEIYAPLPDRVPNPRSAEGRQAIDGGISHVYGDVITEGVGLMSQRFFVSPDAIRASLKRLGYRWHKPTSTYRKTKRKEVTTRR